MRAFADGGRFVDLERIALDYGEPAGRGLAQFGERGQATPVALAKGSWALG